MGKRAKSSPPPPYFWKPAHNRVKVQRILTQNKHINYTHMGFKNIHNHIIRDNLGSESPSGLDMAPAETRFLKKSWYFFSTIFWICGLVIYLSSQWCVWSKSSRSRWYIWLFLILSPADLELEPMESSRHPPSYISILEAPWCCDLWRVQWVMHSKL